MVELNNLAKWTHKTQLDCVERPRAHFALHGQWLHLNCEQILFIRYCMLMKNTKQ